MRCYIVVHCLRYHSFSKRKKAFFTCSVFIKFQCLWGLVLHCEKYARIQIVTDPYFPVLYKNNGQEKSVSSHILCSVNYLSGSKLIKLLNFYFKLKPKLATVVCNFKRLFFCDCSLRTYDKSRVWSHRSKCIKVIITADIGALWWPGFNHG